MNTGTIGMIVPSSVLTNPPDDAIVTAVVVLKFATMISLAAEIRSRPRGDRIKAIERLVVIGPADDRFTGVTEATWSPLCPQ
jgi:hypothetical protein